jgi:glycosyltransferase involved in cell wall biosynthesis
VEERFRPIDDGEALAEFRGQHGLPDRFILYLGTIEPRKNLLRLIDAYAELRRDRVTEWPLIIAGGRGWQDEAVFQRAAETSVARDIRFAGYVPDQELPLWYNAAALFVYPSEYEGFGLPVLEALACGAPVVTGDRSSIPEVAGDAAVLVDPSSTQAIRDGMACVLEDNSFRAQLATRGPQRAREFSWRRMAEETLAVYRAVSYAA